MKPSRNQRIQPTTAKPSAPAGRGRNQRIGQPASGGATKKSAPSQPSQQTPTTPATTTTTPATSEPKQKGWGAKNPHQKQILALATPTSSSSDTSTETPIAPLFQPVYVRNCCHIR